MIDRSFVLHTILYTKLLTTNTPSKRIIFKRNEEFLKKRKSFIKKASVTTTSQEVFSFSFHPLKKNIIIIITHANQTQTQTQNRNQIRKPSFFISHAQN